MGTTQTNRERNSSIAGAPLFARFLERLGFERLSSSSVVPWRLGPLAWYALFVVFVEAVVLQAYNVWTGRGVVFLENPLWLVRPVVFVGAALATRALHARYDRAVHRSHLRERASDPGRFQQLVPAPLEASLLALGIAFTVLNALVVLTIPQLYAVGGPARVVRFLVVTPFGYVPVLAAFLATYVAVEVGVPYRLLQSDVQLDFLDPQQLGGMRPVGELVKVAYYFTMVGLVLYALATYGPYLLDGVLAYEALDPPGAAVNAVFTAVWAAAVGVMACGIYLLHQYMTREKQDALYELDTEARQYIDSPWDITAADVANPADEYEAYRERIEHIRTTREYPATFTMWSQLAVGVMIPKAVQLLLSAF